jgi:hypothetical protein
MCFKKLCVDFEGKIKTSDFSSLGTKNFNEFLKKNIFYGKATLNCLQNFLVSNVTSPKAELL